jgi:tellurite resistance protein TerC
MDQSVGSPALWGGFLAAVVAMLALDLGVFHRKEHVVKAREAAIWSAVWIGLSLLFNLLVWHWFGPQKAVEFLTGYLIEKSLSVDNIFVFVVIFATMGVRPIHQHRVLFWGILSALVFRGAMIIGGTALLHRFHWLIYVFGAFLVATGVKLFLGRNEEQHPEEGWVFRTLRKVIPSTSRFDGHHFFTKENGKRVATPLLLTLALIEVSDVLFALDSIPAIFAVTEDPFIVFTSNICAILGLRSLYFLVAGLMDKFTYLKVGLSAVLVYVGVKMTVAEWVKIPALLSLAVIATLLGISMLASLAKSKRQARDAAGAAPLRSSEQHP